MDPSTVTDHDVQQASVKANPFIDYIGPHGTSFGKLIVSIGIPIIGYLSIQHETLEAWLDVAKRILLG
ncbi:hypothetical protein [Jannaschia donghaensis]|uniref:hypothetical protein n=1 Tax=Jannaschia donghaensis TaxID=420998 RepID=UPI00118735EE|nr:hypothetical protein [Jannaschia donghaensis]